MFSSNLIVAKLRKICCPALLLVLTPFLFAACATPSSLSNYVPNFSWTYKIDIQQGVVITKEMVGQLRPGMTRDQVRFVLGSPAIADAFHTNQWDYTYTIQKRGGAIEIRKFTVLFENNRLKSFAGDPLPSEKDFDINPQNMQLTPTEALAENPERDANFSEAQNSPVLGQ